MSDIANNITIIKGVTGTLDTLVKLLDHVKNKLVGQPEAAAKALGTVIEEINQGCLAVDEAFSKYTSILFNPAVDLYHEWNIQAQDGENGAKLSPSAKWPSWSLNLTPSTLQGQTAYSLLLGTFSCRITRTRNLVLDTNF